VSNYARDLYSINPFSFTRSSKNIATFFIIDILI
jgi:hypothetical protein